MLRTGRQGESVLNMSASLVSRSGGLAGLARVSFSELGAAALVVTSIAIHIPRAFLTTLSVAAAMANPIPDRSNTPTVSASR